MKEIERKFLVRDRSFLVGASASRIRQGYIAREGRTAVRVRERAGVFTLNVKREQSATTRIELEWPISAAEGDLLLREVCERVLDKTRYEVLFGGKLFEVDEFHGANEGLIVAEIELNSEDEEFSRPPWLGPEVTEDRRFLNVLLIEAPFSDFGVTYAELLRQCGG